MLCGGCGATIAEKAIVCYRCGTPTAVPAPLRREGGVRTKPSLLLPILIVLLALALGWFALSAVPQSMRQIGAGAGAVAGLAVGIYLMVQRRR